MKYKVVYIWEPGDHVRWKHDTRAMSRSALLEAGSGTVTALDPDDDHWDVRVESGSNDDCYWFSSLDLLPLLVLPKPPTFSSMEEAEAWLEANKH